jgi:hypothetical protein
MSGKILEFNGVTRLDINPDIVIAAAQKRRLDGIIMIGLEEDGEFFFASSYADGGDVLWLMELAKKRLMEDA